MVLVFSPLTLNLEESMKNIKQLRREIVKHLKDRNIFDATIHHSGGREVRLTMPLTTESSRLLHEIKKSKTSGIKYSSNSGLEVKAPNLNYLKNFFRRGLNTSLESALD